MLKRSRKRGFRSVAEVQAALKKGSPVYYQAPLSHHPVRINGIARPFGKGRIYIRASAIDRDADNFTADSGHLDRFLQDE